MVMNKKILDKDTLRGANSYIKDVLDSVEALYDKNMLDDAFLSDYIHLASISISIGYKSSKWDEIGYECCKKLKFLIETYRIDKLSNGMLSGFGYTCYCVNKYSSVSGRLESFSLSLNDLLFENFRDSIVFKDYKDIVVSSSDFDLISGATGIISYLLSLDQKFQDKYETILRDSTKYLLWLTENKIFNQDKIFNFHIESEQQFLEYEKTKFFKGNINFGMSHGILPIAITLSKLYDLAPEKREIEDSVYKILELYRTFKCRKNNILYWPGQLPIESYSKGVVSEEDIHFASSWCYGNMGILDGLLVLSDELPKMICKKDIVEEIYTIFVKSPDDYYLVSPSICHGFASVLMGVLPVMSDFNDQFFVRQINSITKKIIMTSLYSTQVARQYPDDITNDEGTLEGYIGDYSFLNGVTGIVCVLVEIIQGHNDYRTLLST